VKLVHPGEARNADPRGAGVHSERPRTERQSGVGSVDWSLRPEALVRMWDVTNI
jgi:hypothetical protein